VSIRWKDSNTIRTFIIVKSALLIVLWASLDHFYVGDRKSLAEQPEASPSVSPSPASAGKPTEQKAEKRKSFLDNLLNLPALDPDKLKREEISRFLALAERKKKQVDERLEMLKLRETQLTKIETSIDEKLKKLDEERRFFAQTVQREKELKGQRLDRLVELYDKMEPKKAAPVMEQMDKDLVVSLFKRLKQKQVTTVLEFMKPDKSVELSEYYGRVRSGREYDLLREMNVSLRKEFSECKGMGPSPDTESDIEKSEQAEVSEPPKTAEPVQPPKTTEPDQSPKTAELAKKDDATPKEQPATKETVPEKEIQDVAPVPVSAGDSTDATPSSADSKPAQEEPAVH